MFNMHFIAEDIMVNVNIKIKGFNIYIVVVLYDYLNLRMPFFQEHSRSYFASELQSNITDWFVVDCIIEKMFFEMYFVKFKTPVC